MTVRNRYSIKYHTRDIDLTERLDATGATTSLLCAVHCALMPFVVTLLPLIGLGFLASERIEWLLLGLSGLIGISSLCFGFREHRSRRALVVLSLGLTLLASGRVAEQREMGRFGVALVVCGGLTVATAHFINRRLCAACRVCKAAPATQPRSLSQSK